MSLFIDTRNKFEFERLPDDAPLAEFTPVAGLGATGDSETDLYIRVEKKLRTGSHTILYLCTILDDGKDTDKKMVLKLDPLLNHIPALEREAHAYNDLAKIQGTVIPLFYGAFQGPFYDATVTCLAMSYCGEPVSGSLFDRNPETRDYKLKIIDKLIQLHDAGYEHGDIVSTDNVVDMNGEPFLVDLEHARPHECDRAMDIDTQQRRPLLSQFKCVEIYRLAKEMCLWESPIVEFYGSFVPKACLKTADDLVSVVATSLTEDQDTRQRLTEEAQVLVNLYGPKSSSSQSM